MNPLGRLPLHASTCKFSSWQFLVYYYYLLDKDGHLLAKAGYVRFRQLCSYAEEAADIFVAQRAAINLIKWPVRPTQIKFRMTYNFPSTFLILNIFLRLFIITSSFVLFINLRNFIHIYQVNISYFFTNFFISMYHFQFHFI